MSPLPSFLVHSILPLLVLLSFRRLDARKVWLLWPLTHVPDFDYFFGFHRATLGNVFILLPFAAVLAWSLRPATRNPQRVEWMLIALAYLGSHLLMDVFTGGSVLFYPFSLHTTCFLIAVDVVTATNTPLVFFEPCSYEGIPVVSEVYPWLSVSEGAMLALLAPIAVAVALAALLRRRTAPLPPAETPK